MKQLIGMVKDNESKLYNKMCKMKKVEIKANILASFGTALDRKTGIFSKAVDKKKKKNVFENSKDTFYHQYFCRNILQIFLINRNSALNAKMRFRNKFIEKLSKTSKSAKYFLDRIRKMKKNDITRY